MRHDTFAPHVTPGSGTRLRDRVALITVDNEGARVPEEGQATRASDIDVVFADYRRPSSLLEKLAFEGHAFHGGAT